MAFYKCINADKNELKDTTFIDEKTFYNCKKLKGTLIIQDNIETIGELAFGETNYDSISYSGSGFVCGSNVFTNNPNIDINDNYHNQDICGVLL